MISEQTYRKLTGDLRTPVSDVTSALVVAEGLVEVRLGRALSLAEYTETLNVYPNQTVYPSVTPLDPATPGYLNKSTLRLATYTPDPVNASFWYWWSDGTADARRATVTYTGGYTDETLPQPLQTGISLVAKHLMSPTSDLSMAGVKSYSEGDISATFETAMDSTWPAGIWSLIRRYAHSEAVSA
jgi:hypothetical protein